MPRPLSFTFFPNRLQPFYHLALYDVYA